jgi:cytochrome c-type biogenesis protein CcmE
MKRAKKLAIAVAVLAAASLLILWNTASSQGPTTLGVGDAKREAGTLKGAPVAVRGTVVEDSIVTNGTVVESFMMADDYETLLVIYGQTPPDGFGPKEVIVNGAMRVGDDGTVTLVANSLFVGCSSKY